MSKKTVTKIVKQEKIKDICIKCIYVYKMNIEVIEMLLCVYVFKRKLKAVAGGGRRWAPEWLSR